ncbi:MAG: LacI family DNA-binding transcriptional regulator [Chloroflexota bacterium]
MEAGRRRPTIDDVARHAGVSIATVSRVLNGSAPVVGETADRVRRAVTALDYRPTAAARILAQRRTNTIGLVLPHISGDYMASLLRGIEAEVRRAGMHLLVSTAGAGGGSALGDHNTDGLLIFAGGLDDAEVRRVWARRHPVVLLHRTPPEALPIPCVTVENKEGARAIVEHLIHVHGHRRIGYLRGPAGHEDSAWRELGFREALEERGIDPDAARIGTGDFSVAGGEAQTATWIASGRPLDAIFAGDDASAIGALRALRAAWMAGRVAVVGFDDTPIARHCTPALTTVSAPTEEVGAEAVRQLLALERGLPVMPLVLLPTRVIVRGSCGCAEVTAQGFGPRGMA